jgi:hypothetical protein
LKPENILIAGDVVKLSDFGGGRYATDLKTLHVSKQDGRVTPYAAPELLDYAKKYTYKVDIWSLGVILFELVYGVVPWKSNPNDIKSLKAELQSFSEVKFPAGGAVTRQTQSFIKSMLQVNESRRADLETLMSLAWLNVEPDESLAGSELYTVPQRITQEELNKYPVNDSKSSIMYNLRTSLVGGGECRGNVPRAAGLTEAQIDECQQVFWYEINLCVYLTKLLCHVGEGIEAYQKLKQEASDVVENDFTAFKFATLKFQLLAMQYANELLEGTRNDAEIRNLSQFRRANVGDVMRLRVKEEAKKYSTTLEHLYWELVSVWSPSELGELSRWSELKSVELWGSSSFRGLLNKTVQSMLKRVAKVEQRSKSAGLAFIYLQLFERALKDLHWNNVFPKTDRQVFNFSTLWRVEESDISSIKRDLASMIPCLKNPS